MTKQEMFTKVWLGLAGQNWKRSVDGSIDDRCVYRSPIGLKCAAGHLIPDEKYESRFESWNIRNLLEKNPALLGFTLDESEIAFLSKMQRAHDSFGVLSEEYDDMKRAFLRLAELSDLQIPEENS